MEPSAVSRGLFLRFVHDLRLSHALLYLESGLATAEINFLQFPLPEIKRVE